MQVFVLAQHAPEAGRLQRLLGPDFKVTGVAALPAAGPIDADVLVGTALGAAEAARWRGRLLQVPGAGTDGIALDAVWPGAAICNVYGHEIPMAEFALLAMLESQIRLSAIPSRLDAAHWPAAYRGRTLHGELAGQRLLLIGFGHIGQEIARRARAFGVTVAALTRGGAPHPLADETALITKLLEMLPTADTVVLCCPLTDETRGLINAKTLAAMKPTAQLINLARADVVDEEALFEALKERRIGGAWLDVWYRYPKAGESEVAPARLPFWELPNVRCTPHASAWTENLLVRRYALMADNIRSIAEGGTLQNVVRQKEAGRAQ